MAILMSAIVLLGGVASGFLIVYYRGLIVFVILVLGFVTVVSLFAGATYYTPVTETEGYTPVESVVVAITTDVGGYPRVVLENGKSSLWQKGEMIPSAGDKAMVWCNGENICFSPGSDAPHIDWAVVIAMVGMASIGLLAGIRLAEKIYYR